jgi:hypothetical protein
LWKKELLDGICLAVSWWSHEAVWQKEKNTIYSLKNDYHVSAF